MKSALWFSFSLLNPQFQLDDGGVQIQEVIVSCSALLSVVFLRVLSLRAVNLVSHALTIY